MPESPLDFRRPAQPVVYRIDADDRMEFVNETWHAFAIENGATELTAAVIGTPLWDHILGPGVTHVYRDLLYRVRTKRVTATFPFRCDSPERYRKMRLTVNPLAEGRVEFLAILEDEGFHSISMPFLRPASGIRSEEVVRMCAWCKAIAVHDVWKPLEEAIVQTELLLQEPFPCFTHGICEDCVAQYERLAP
jgi:hypothetical protein